MTWEGSRESGGVLSMGNLPIAVSLFNRREHAAEMRHSGHRRETMHPTQTTSERPRCFLVDSGGPNDLAATVTIAIRVAGLTNILIVFGRLREFPGCSGGCGPDRVCLPRSDCRPRSHSIAFIHAIVRGASVVFDFGGYVARQSSMKPTNCRAFLTDSVGFVCVVVLASENFG